MSPLDMEKQPLLPARSDPPAADDEAQRASLSELQRNVFKAQREYMKAWHKTTSGLWHRRIMYSVTLLLLLFFGFCFAVLTQDALSGDFPIASGKVLLEAHIMSKCPDARDCLRDMILPAMQNISDKVDFKLSYIGRITEDEDGVECMHGEEECLGNIIELCAARLYPDVKTYLGFTMCLSRQYSDIPKRSLIEDCALEHGISMQTLNECTVQDDGALSLDMLKSSFNRSAEAGVTKSCTVRLDGKVRCIRDGGEWKDCEGGSTAEDLVKDVLKLSKTTGLNC